MLTYEAGAGSEQSAESRGVEQPALRPPGPGSLLCLTSRDQAVQVTIILEHPASLPSLIGG